jgi:hypothetical protein
MKRVTAPAVSAMSSARTAKWYRSAAIGAATAASASPAATARAPSAVLDAAMKRALGSVRRSQPRTCASACGIVVTVLTSARAMSGRASSAKETASCTSRTICNGSPVASSSRVSDTEPSTEFSKGTSAAATSPWRTASSASATETHGTGSTPCAAGSERSAASQNVPCGPR